MKVSFGRLKRLGKGVHRRGIPSMWRRFANRRLATKRQRIVAGLVAVVFIFGIVTPIIVTQRKAEAWWNANWTKRQKITIDNSASLNPLTGFPIRVALTPTIIDYSKTKAAGADIRFLASDDVTPLDYQIENWVSNGNSNIWVNIPTLANNNTNYIYMYYNNPSAVDAQTATSVWDGNFKGVWHMNETGNGTVGEFKDSTSNGNNGRGGGGTSSQVPTSTSGPIGNGLNFSRANQQYFSVPASSTFNSITGNITQSVWVKSTTAAVYEGLMMNTSAAASNTNYDLLICDNTCTGTSDRYFTYSDGTSPVGINTVKTVDTTSWHNVVYTRSGSTATFYVDGNFDSSATVTGAFPGNAGSLLFFGSDGTAANTFLNGGMDESRLSNIARSADWVKAEFLTATDAMNSFAAAETYTSGSGGLTNWYQPCWTYRKKITINTSNFLASPTLTNFPLFVSLTTSNFNFSHALSTGNDIRFVATDNTTVLNYDRESWTANTSAAFWVNSGGATPLFQNSTYEFYMYYGCSTAPDGANPTAVWDSNYKGVWHLAESGNGTAGEIKDSTSNGNNGQALGSTRPTQTTGLMGFGELFSRSGGSYISVPSNSAFTGITGDITISSWFNTSTLNAYQVLMAVVGSGATSTNYEHFLCDATTCGTGNKVYWYSDGTSPSNLTGTAGSIAANTWYYVTSTRSGNTFQAYINGTASGASQSQTGSFIGVSGNNLQFGTDAITTATTLNGMLDENRISNVARSAAWIKAEYLTGNTASPINTFAAEEIYPPDPPVLTDVASPLASSLTPVFRMRSSDQNSPNYLRYKVQVCSNSDCSTVVRTIDQTASQTGWSGQDAQTSTAYVASATVASSTLATHTYQAPALTAGTQYWWRAYAIDPGGGNSFSGASNIGTFVTEGPPAAPTLLLPVASSTNVGLLPEFRMYTTDPNSSDVQYKIDVCLTSNCSSIVRTIDQTASQTGWLSQNSGSTTRYTSGLTLPGTQQAIHQYQPPALTVNTQYYWRAYAIDPTGSNTFGPASSIGTFTTTGNTGGERITGGTTIKGGTKIGN